MNANLISIKYIGQKPFSMDNVAKSGKAWNGNGDVQDVTPRQAKLLLTHPGQWALADGRQASRLEGPNFVETEDANGNTVLTDEADLTGHIEKMTTAELVAYAQLKYGKTLKANRGRKLLLDEVMALDGQIDVL